MDRKLVRKGLAIFLKYNGSELEERIFGLIKEQKMTHDEATIFLDTTRRYFLWKTERKLNRLKAEGKKILAYVILFSAYYISLSLIIPMTGCPELSVIMIISEIVAAFMIIKANSERTKRI